MNQKVKIGIIICDRYRSCSGGKCFRALRERVGAFSVYQTQDVELIGYTTCGGCPGGNIEYAIDEMKRNGAQAIHLSTGFIVGYPPCPYIEYFRDFIEAKIEVPVIYGTHPIPEKYHKIHKKLGTWNDPKWNEIIEPALDTEKTRRSYN